MNMDDGNYRLYKVLEVSKSASTQEIKQAYRALALRYHPDKAGVEGEEKFKAINEAKSILCDPQKRSMYDKYGDRGLQYANNDFTAPMMNELGLHAALLLALVLAVVTMSCIIITLSTVAARLDGRMSWTWGSTFWATWVWFSVVMLVVVFSTIVMVRNYFKDKENSVVTWKNAIAPAIVTLYFLFAAFFVGNLDHHQMTWPEVIIPLILAEFIIMFLSMKGNLPANVKREIAIRMGIEDPPAWIVLCLSINNWLSQLLRIVLIILLSEKAQGAIPSTSVFAVLIPLYIIIALSFLTQWCQLTLLVKAGQLESGKRYINIFWYAITICLPFISIMLIADKVQNGSSRSFGTCLIPVWIQLAGGFLLLCCGVCAMSGMLMQDTQAMADQEVPPSSDEPREGENMA